MQALGILFLAGFSMLLGAVFWLRVNRVAGVLVYTVSRLAAVYMVWGFSRPLRIDLVLTALLVLGLLSRYVNRLVPIVAAASLAGPVLAPFVTPYPRGIDVEAAAAYAVAAALILQDLIVNLDWRKALAALAGMNLIVDMRELPSIAHMPAEWQLAHWLLNPKPLYWLIIAIILGKVDTKYAATAAIVLAAANMADATIHEPFLARIVAAPAAYLLYRALSMA